MAESNLERGFNPCCGHITDSAAELLDNDFIDSCPTADDIGICLNCGTVLVYLDGPRNKTRLARRQDIEGLPKRERRILRKVQAYIWARGLIHPRITG